MFPFRLFAKDIALDLGTANTLIYLKGLGVVLDEPTMIAISSREAKVLAVGKRAKEIYGKNPKDIQVIRPIKDGSIADIEAAQLMINIFLQKAIQRRCLLRPRIISCVPSGITAVERAAVIDSMRQAGARNIYLIEEPMAAAIGEGLPVDEAVGNMIVNIGGGMTEVAIITSYGVESWDSIRIAGNEMDESIQALFKQKYDLQIGIFDAERVKIGIGSAIPLQEEITMEVRGKSFQESLPRIITTSSGSIREALEGPLHAISDLIRRTLERTAPELAGDIYDRGIVLSGGGGLLRGLDTYLREVIHLPFHVAKDPLTAAVRGAGMVLDEFSQYHRVCTEYNR